MCRWRMQGWLDSDTVPLVPVELALHSCGGFKRPMQTHGVKQAFCWSVGFAMRLNASFLYAEYSKIPLVAVQRIDTQIDVESVQHYLTSRPVHTMRHYFMLLHLYN